MILHVLNRGVGRRVLFTKDEDDWVQMANQPQTEAELEALRCCVNRGRPFDGLNWVTDTAKRWG